MFDGVSGWQGWTRHRTEHEDILAERIMQDSLFPMQQYVRRGAIHGYR